MSVPAVKALMWIKERLRADRQCEGPKFAWLWQSNLMKSGDIARSGHYARKQYGHYGAWMRLR